MTLRSATTPAMPPAVRPIAPSERLQVLDILRGFAILGMFVVHINDYARGGGAIGAAIQRAVVLFVENKSYTTFAILFGVGCAIQLHRADAPDKQIRRQFLRRLIGLWSILMVLGALTGRGGTIFGYVFAGVWLLFIRRWSTRALLVVLVAAAMLDGARNVAMGSYQWATMGVERANEVYRSPRSWPARQAANAEQLAARDGTSYPRFVAANFKRDLFIVADPLGDWSRGNNPGLLFGSLSRSSFMLFVIGLLAFRRGVFHRPADHRRILTAAAFVGAALWVIDEWQLYNMLWSRPSVLSAIPVARVAAPIQSWFLFDAAGWFLALTYISGILLLVGFSKAWERRLAAVFGAAGRMAFTNYTIQFAVLSTAANNWGFGLGGKLTPQVVPVAAVILFGALVVFSRWWLARFRLGPVEWLLRSVTYAQVQPLRRTVEQAVHPI